MSRRRRALIVGGGVGGMAAAIALRRHGWTVELVERDPHWRVAGAGITLTGPTLRAFHQLGVFEEVERRGFLADGIDVCDADGTVRSRISTPRPEGADVPGSGGILRPVLHNILSTRVLADGVDVRLGQSVEALTPLDDGVRAAFTDGSSGTYDLVVGADGLRSKVRSLLFPNAAGPVFTGQVCWRVSVPRPAEIDRRRYFLGGPVKAGLTPVSQGEMYMFLLEIIPEKRHNEGPLHLRLQELIAGFGGLLADLRDSLDERSPIVPRPLESFLMPRPWRSGCSVLIGDAAHPTTPQLASGAGLAVEDALVLAESLANLPAPEALEAFTARRFERCRMVVETSIEIGRLEQAGASAAAQAALVQSALAELAEPI